MKREPKQTLRCQLCNEVFETVREDAKFCSGACRQLAHRVRNGKSIVIRSKRLIGPGRFPAGSWDAR
jgi:Zn finger protein HypA/HybF involved in hydrogenase expression